MSLTIGQACGSETSVMYASFAVRGRLCKDVRILYSASIISLSASFFSSYNVANPLCTTFSMSYLYSTFTY